MISRVSQLPLSQSPLYGGHQFSLTCFTTTQEEFLSQRYKREPLTALAVTTLMGLAVAWTALGTSSLVILQEMEIIHSQLSDIRKDKDCIMLFSKVFVFLSKGNLTK